MNLIIPPRASLSTLIALLVEHGADALLAAEGIEACAGALLTGPLTIRERDRAAYGDAAAWAAWEALRADHGDRLRAMADAYRDRIRAENDRACDRAQIRGTGSVGGDWLRETGR